MKIKYKYEIKLGTIVFLNEWFFELISIQNDMCELQLCNGFQREFIKMDELIKIIKKTTEPVVNAWYGDYTMQL